MMLPDFYLQVSIEAQQLNVMEQGSIVKSYSVSTARNGPGQQMGSECTPTGWHQIRAKIGADLPSGSVFVGRRATGEIYTDELARQYPDRDWILSRILWLTGLEPGKNRYGQVDSGWRYIYIHGCPDELINGKPGSHGCIRMRNRDIIELFERVRPGCRVYIQ